MMKNRPIELFYFSVENSLAERNINGSRNKNPVDTLTSTGFNFSY